MNAPEKIDICGVSVHNCDMRQAVDFVESLIRSKQCHYVVTPNIDHIVKLQTDTEFKSAYDAASLVLPDGMPLIWAGQFLGTPFKSKVSGSDLFEEMSGVAAKKGLSVYLLGAAPGVADRAAQTLKARFPGLRVAGIYSPPLGFERDGEEIRRINERIRTAAPDILFLGLGTPKQEKWMYRHKDSLGPLVGILVGASFDFTAGVVRRAPRWMQQTGLEWLWRLGLEPRRLWKRYLVEDPAFFWLLLRQKFSKKRPVR